MRVYWENSSCRNKWWCIYMLWGIVHYHIRLWLKYRLNLHQCISVIVCNMYPMLRESVGNVKSYCKPSLFLQSDCFVNIKHRECVCYMHFTLIICITLIYSRVHQLGYTCIHKTLFSISQSVMLFYNPFTVIHFEIVLMGTVYPSDKNQWVKTQIQWVKNCNQ